MVTLRHGQAAHFPLIRAEVPFSHSDAPFLVSANYFLCGRRSHSTAAALLHGGSTSAAIIGRRGRVAQLTVLIPEVHSSIYVPAGALSVLKAR